ncbi:MAG: hypothetical protein MK132_27300 [Lentisphaerales bacterium]|nr:hypothetical protein [Lentisphaerales bacterium]
MEIIGVAEAKVKAQSIGKGEDFLIIGETTGVVELTAYELGVEECVEETAKRDDLFSFKVPEEVRRND